MGDTLLGAMSTDDGDFTQTSTDGGISGASGYSAASTSAVSASVTTGTSATDASPKSNATTLTPKSNATLTPNHKAASAVGAIGAVHLMNSMHLPDTDIVLNVGSPTIINENDDNDNNAKEIKNRIVNQHSNNTAMNGNSNTVKMDENINNDPNGNDNLSSMHGNLNPNNTQLKPNLNGNSALEIETPQSKALEVGIPDLDIPALMQVRQLSDGINNNDNYNENEINNDWRDKLARIESLAGMQNMDRSVSTNLSVGNNNSNHNSNNNTINDEMIEVKQTIEDMKNGERSSSANINRNVSDTIAPKTHSPAASGSSTTIAPRAPVVAGGVGGMGVNGNGLGDDLRMSSDASADPDKAATELSGKTMEELNNIYAGTNDSK